MKEDAGEEILREIWGAPEGEKKTCCLCGTVFTEWGNNPEPIKSFEEGKCCNYCNDKHVIPARIRDLFVGGRFIPKEEL
tara:strand:- start:3466 stop:3702 length:237 start_codon:yes stop_codon:yes gene_type:complete